MMLAVALALALVPAAPAKTVKIGDNFFSPKKLTVDRGSTVRWKWPAADEAGDVHDVALTKRPKGVKRFHSEAAATDYSYKRKLKKPGTYKIVCTLHEEMRMTIKVRK
jgi:plastocyanin